MKLKHIKLPLIILFSLALLIAIAPTVQAQFTLPTCTATGYCSLCDILQTVINFGKFLLGIVGSLALLMFVYGGFKWLTSGGESKEIEEGKKILVNSVIGIGITFFAWVVVTFVVTALTASTGWNWNLELSCAALPGLPPVGLENRGTSTTKKEGDTCTKSEECGTDLFCNATARCQKKLGTGLDCKGLTIEASQLANSSGVDLVILASGPAGWPALSAAKYLAVMHESDVACMSNDCNVLNGAGFGKCDEPAAGQGIIQINQPCQHTNECYPSLYCRAVDGKCQTRSKIGEPCPAAWEIDGNANNICTYVAVTGAAITAQCDTNIEKCIPGPGRGTIGQICTGNSQCQPFFSCACDGAATATQKKEPQGCAEGKCTPKITTGDGVTFCDGWSVNGEDDNSRCTTNKCEDGMIGYTGICDPTLSP
jgi:hypothetical protein